MTDRRSKRLRIELVCREPRWKVRRADAADRRARRGCLRHRRGAGGPHRGARGRAARLVGCRAGGAERRLERVGPQHRRGAAGICRRAADALDRARRSRSRPRRCGSASEAGAEYVRNAARDMPGTALAENGWLHVSSTDDPAAMAHEAALLAGEFGAAVEPWPAEPGARGAALAALFSRSALSARLQHAIRSTMRSGSPPRRKRRARASSRIRRSLEIDPAGVRKRVVTPHSRVRAGHVVLAGNVHYPDLVPQFASTLAAGLQHGGRHRAAGRRSGGGDRLSRRGERQR